VQPACSPARVAPRTGSVAPLRRSRGDRHGHLHPRRPGQRRWRRRVCDREQGRQGKDLSRSLIELWGKADAHTPKGDVGPADFDPVTNSQEPDVKSFKVAAEKMEADTAVIAVTIAGRNAVKRKPADQVVRYNFVRDGTEWKIDDIRGASDGEPWSIRQMLAESLKN
jgi:hypothetical protein